MILNVVQSDLDPTAEVMRLREYEQSFFPDRSKIRPVPETFELSDVDKEDAVPLLSVWDTGKTKLEEAK